MTIPLAPSRLPQDFAPKQAQTKKLNCTRAWARLCLVVLALWACGSETSKPTAGRAALPSDVATPTASDGSEAGDSSIAAGQGMSPSAHKVAKLTLAINSDFADPGALLHEGVFYAYATNGDGKNVRVASSTDLKTWQTRSDALPTLPSWASAGYTWAPDVLKLADDAFVLYFTARHSQSGKQGVGVATSSQATGPFISRASAPLVCQLSTGGTIDASAFTASNGRHYLLYKNDGNCCGYAVNLYGRELSNDGLSFVDGEKLLLSTNQTWEGGLIEAPAMIEQDGFFYLFYSANSFSNNKYASGVARASAPLGPFYKINNGLFLASDGSNLDGPGGITPIRDGNGLAYLFLHNWNSTQYNYRSFWLAPLVWENGVPRAIIQ